MMRMVNNATTSSILLPLVDRMVVAVSQGWKLEEKVCCGMNWLESDWTMRNNEILRFKTTKLQAAQFEIFARTRSQIKSQAQFTEAIVRAAPPTSWSWQSM
mmetsp:Transcript_9455/g.17061  ORF Transcript_9455/g.17061 Transcript_9455/m.17061 type:complete len:101 (-) Transcript_9455:290-592(-)